MASFAYDTGAGEGISTSKDDFIYLDTSEKSRNSCTIQGPSVGTPTCEGRGPLVYIFKVGGRIMGLVHPNGILASSSMGSSEFRLASAMQLKKKEVRYLGGKLNEKDIIECVRSGMRVPATNNDGILTIKIDGFASDLEGCDELLRLVKDIDGGLTSPLIDVSPFIKHSSQLEQTHLKTLIDGDEQKIKEIKVFLLNESKLTAEERSRLYCRRFAYCDTKIFKIMHGREEFGDFPNLPSLNEDNIVADLSKFKRKPYKRNDPANTMNSPPFWRVFCDGYGGQQSLDGPSYEGAIGAYLFVCSSTGSTDIRLYASHKQFPIALHQFLVRVQAE
jgi:hypothetical protein